MQNGIDMDSLAIVGMGRHAFNPRLGKGKWEKRKKAD